ncbi:MAG: hypothetical protein M3Y21_06540 [Candidatus Eremiobacteraeota bacterium]|nr:hypothetical protein [Candidatus Eremiobacteraeota bacterium]
MSKQTRRVLAEAASTQDMAGASALARDILERWAGEAAAKQTQASVEKAVSYLRAHPEGWDDDPTDFFPGIARE